MYELPVLLGLQLPELGECAMFREQALLDREVLLRVGSEPHLVIVHRAVAGPPNSKSRPQTPPTYGFILEIIEDTQVYLRLSRSHPSASKIGAGERVAA